MLTTVPSHSTTFTLSRSKLRAVEHSKITLEVALRDALDGVTWPKYDESGSQILLTSLFSDLVSVSMSYGVSYIFHRYILSTVEVQSKHVCHTAVCGCIYSRVHFPGSQYFFNIFTFRYFFHLPRNLET